MAVGWRAGSLRATLALAVLLVGALVPLPDAAADRLEPDGGRLPWARWGAAAAWDGQRIVVAGGAGDPRDPDRAATHGATDELLVYDPIGQEVEYLRARLPSPRLHAAAASDGRNVWLFGGLGCLDGACESLRALDEIVRVNRTAREATVVARLPTAVMGGAALWDGERFLVLGGRTDSETRGHDAVAIVAFDPRTNRVVTLPERLPSGRSFAVATWVGDHALVFGGEKRACAQRCPDREILLVQPDRHAVTRLEARLPYGMPRAMAARIGDSMLLFDHDGDPAIVRFDVVQREFRRVDAAVSSVAIPPEAAVAGDGARAYLLGGRASTKVLRFEFDLADRPSAPRLMQAMPGESAGRVALSWREPAHADGVEGYRIYRSFGRGQPQFVAAVDGLAYVDTGLPAGAQARYLVAAVNGAGEGAQAEVTILVPGLPCAPRSLRGTPGPGAGHVTLRWQIPSCDGGLPIERYAVYRSRGASGPVLVALVETETLTYAPPKGLLYTYRVAAANVAGEGPATRWVGVQPPKPPLPPDLVNAAPEGTGLRLQWEPTRSALPLTSFVVERSVAGNAFQVAAELPAAARSHVDQGCPLAKECRYRVQAVSAAGASEPSNVRGGAGRSFFPAAQLRPDGTLYVYNDADRDGTPDPGEGLAVTPQPPVRPPSPL